METIKLDLREDATRQGIRAQLFAMLDDQAIARIEDQVASLACHEPGGQITDPAGGTGDQRPLSFHLIHRCFPFRSVVIDFRYRRHDKT